jgi:hypothetical protein
VVQTVILHEREYTFASVFWEFDFVKSPWSLSPGPWSVSVLLVFILAFAHGVTVRACRGPSIDHPLLRGEAWRRSTILIDPIPLMHLFQITFYRCIAVDHVELPGLQREDITNGMALTSLPFIPRTIIELVRRSTR